ncbi:MAG: N-6 DNA methylase [Vulcanimicrobiota bacterium]
MDTLAEERSEVEAGQIVMDLKKELKQFFTPVEIAGFMVLNSNISSKTRIIDPSVGGGIFASVLENRPINCFHGIDIDNEIIARLNNKYKKQFQFFCGHGLKIENSSYDLAIGNPPFSNQKNRISDKAILSHFQLGKDRKSQSIEVLFIEKFIQLLKPGGQLRIILPQNIFANTNLQYIRNYLFKNLFIEAIVELPRKIFRHTPAKTLILFAIKKENKNQRQQEPVRMITLKNTDNIDKKRIIDLPCLEMNPGELITRIDPGFYYKKKKTEAYFTNPEIKWTKLEELADIHTGYMNYALKDRLISGKPGNSELTRIIMAKNIDRKGFLNNYPCFYIDMNSGLYKKNAIACHGDILFVRVGAGCLGRTLLINKELGPVQADDWFFIIKNIQKELIGPYYLNFYLNSIPGKQFIDLHRQGTGTISINKKRLGQIPVPVLNMEFQEKIQEKLIKINELNKEKKEKLEFFFNRTNRELLFFLR